MLTQITVDTGTANPHIFGISDAVIQAALFGQDFVSEDLNKFQPSIASSNEVRIASGVVCIGGHIGYIPYGTYESCTIATGNVGYKRKDLIVARYSRASGLDYMGLYVYKGNPAISNPVLPSYKSEDVMQGGYTREIPVCEVSLDGLSITSAIQYNYKARFLRNLTFSNGNADLFGTGIRTTAIGNKVFINYQHDDIITTVQNTLYGAYEYNGTYAVSVSPRDIQTGEPVPCEPVLETIILDGNVTSNGIFMYQAKEFLAIEDEETSGCYVLIVKFRVISKIAVSNYALHISHNAEMVVNY